MGAKSESILTLLNQIHSDHTLVLPDIQRDFVWKEEQVRLLLDSIMRGYPFGSLLFWQTRFVEVPYREFVLDYSEGQTFITKTKGIGKPLRMVLDGQQRLQAIYIAVHGSYGGRRLYFNVTSGPGAEPRDDVTDDGAHTAFRFEFWRDDDTNRPKRLIPVSQIVGWAPRSEDTQIDAVIEKVALTGEEAARARRNMRALRSLFHQSDLVPFETIDDDVIEASAARPIDEILDIFVRVNSGGTRLSRSDLMFSLIKSKWGSARSAFDDLLRDIRRSSPIDIDKDFIIRGLLTVTESPVSYDVQNVERHWEKLVPAFDQFGKALRTALDFCRAPDVGILSASLLDPLNSLFPVIYYLFQFKDASVPDAQRGSLRTLLYFLLFNRFVRSEARIRYLREELRKHAGKAFPLEGLMNVIAQRQRNTYRMTTDQMVNEHPALSLNIVQPTIARETLSWQDEPQVDHIFPQSRFRSIHPTLVDDIGNLAYLGRLRNIRKNDQLPSEYFADVSDKELCENFLIEDRSMLKGERFEEFVATRREKIVSRAKSFLGR